MLSPEENPLVQIVEFSKTLMPHGYCFLWNNYLIAVFVISNVVVAISYIWISYMIFKVKRSGLFPEFRHLDDLFMTFITFCAISHIFTVITIWFPTYIAEAIVTSVTAIVSIFTALVMKQVIKTLVK